jgi:hypothetical protein
MKFFGRTALVFVGCLFLGSSAFAQATRTWVSGVGDDANPCSRTAPCKTFAGAISKTAVGGEISVLDPGGYGAVTITKPITISGVGEQASILASSVNGVIVNITVAPVAPHNPPVVTLRNIQINGAGTTLGLTAVNVISTIPTQVVLDNVNIFGFSSNGVFANGSNKVTVSGGVFSNISGIAVHSTGSSSIAVENAELFGNNVAVQPDLGSTIRLSNNGVYDNKTGFACGTGGTLASAANNRKANNVGGVVAVCDPTVAITIQ